MGSGSGRIAGARRILLHGRVLCHVDDPQDQQAARERERHPLRFATALKSVLAFWLIIMTYVGVNYVLGIGLHSYGFGTGAVARYMFRLGGTDLALVAICCVIYLIRRGQRAGTEPGTLAVTPA